MAWSLLITLDPLLHAFFFLFDALEVVLTRDLLLLALQNVLLEYVFDKRCLLLNALPIQK